MIRIGDFMLKKKSEQTVEKVNLFSNYVKLFILFAVTVFAVLFIRNLYLKKQNYKLNIPVISETIQQEINRNEIYNYVREYPNALIYVGAVGDSDCRTFEIDFNQIIKKNQLEEEVTYLNLEEERGIKKFFQEFNKFYGSSLEKYPSIIAFKDGKVAEILEVPVGSQYSSSIVQEFLDRNPVEQVENQ